jgi:tetratricopeptide (TPR) repeat protein
MRNRACCVVLIGALLALLPRDAPAAPPRMKPQARRHLDRGMIHYQEKAFDKALRELKRGQKLDPRPEFLYALGQVYRAKGDCPEAIKHYEAFMETAPPPKQAEAAKANIERCKEALAPAKPPRPPPPVEPPPVAAPPPPPPPVEPPPTVLRRPWYRNWTAHALVAGGVATLVTGVVVWQQGRLTIDRAWGATTYESYEARARDLSAADAMQKSGVALMAASGALFVAGALTYVLYRPTERRTSLAVSAGPGGALLIARGRFW